MAQYRYLHFLSHSCDSKFETGHPPGAITQHTGIYKCQGCGIEVVSNAGDPLPPSTHHQHSLTQGGISWWLAIATA